MTLHKHLLTIAAAGMLSVAMGALAVSADEILVQPEATTEAPALVPAPAVPESTGEAAAVAPDATTDETTTEVAPSSGTGTAEEPAYSTMPSEGPGGGCRGHKVEEPSV